MTTAPVASATASTSSSTASSRNLSIRIGWPGEAVDGVRHVAIERAHVVDDRHRAAAEHVGRPDDEREADLRRHLARFFRRRRGAARRLRNAEIPQQLARSARDPRRGRSSRATCRGSGCPASCSGSASFSGVCPPYCTTHATSPPAFLLARDDRRDVLERQRLEVQAIDGVVVGRDRLRVAVDHDRLEPLLAQREGGVAAAVVELDALPDAVRAAAEDHDLLPRRRIGLALLLVGAVEVRRERLELRRAGVDALVGRLEPVLEPRRRAPPPRRRRGSRRARGRRCRRA